MRHRHDRQPIVAMQFLEQSDRLRSRVRVEIARGFVAQQQLGFSQQGPSNRDTLTLSAGEFRRRVARSVRQTQAFEQIMSAFDIDIVIGIRVEESRGRDVLDDGQVREQMEVLKDKPDALPSKTSEARVAQRADVLAPQVDFAFVGAIESADDGEQRAFPRAARTKHRDEFATLNGEIDVGQRATCTFAGIVHARHAFGMNNRIIHGCSKGRDDDLLPIARRFRRLHTHGRDVFTAEKLVLGQTEDAQDEPRRTKFEIALAQEQTRHLFGVRTGQIFERDLIEELGASTTGVRREDQRDVEHVVDEAQTRPRHVGIAGHRFAEEVHVEGHVEGFVTREDAQDVANGGVPGATKSKAIRRRSDRLEHEVCQYDRLDAFGLTVHVEKRPGHFAHGFDGAAEVVEELGQEFAMPTFFISVQSQAFGEFGIPSGDLFREVVGLAQAGFFRAKRGVEEGDRSLPFRFRRPHDRIAQVEFVVVHAFGTLLQHAQPPRRRAPRGAVLRYFTHRYLRTCLGGRYRIRRDEPCPRARKSAGKKGANLLRVKDVFITRDTVEDGLG